MTIQFTTSVILILGILMAGVAQAGEGDVEYGHSPEPSVVQPVTISEAPSLPRPVDLPVDFKESDFNEKPWLNNFKFVVVVNKATSGREAQTARIYINGRALRLHEVIAFEETMNLSEVDFEKKEDRTRRIVELAKMIKGADDTLFKVSTGRDAFEKKGEHHSQKDSWTVTPTGYYPMQHFSLKHKSESYSAAGCDSAIAKFFGAVFRKQFCTYMEFAMFFNGGIALHKAIPGTEGVLGHKASGGCVRMPAALAEYLFYNIKATQAPKVTKIPLVQPDGRVLVDSSGQYQYSVMAPSIWGKPSAWSALVIVQNTVL
jgi:hypothetical protein